MNKALRVAVASAFIPSVTRWLLAVLVSASRCLLLETLSLPGARS